MEPERKLLPVECESIEDIMPSSGTVKALNQIVTDPKGLVEEDMEQDFDGRIEIGIEGIPSEALPELEISREEDYFEVREEGQLEILLEEIMPRECEKLNDGVWLTAVLMGRLAKNQVFGEGNKRTSYLTGVLFLKNLQSVHGFEAVLIPDLDKYFTRLLSDVAIQNNPRGTEDLHKERNLDRDIEHLYNYLYRGLKKHVERNG